MKKWLILGGVVLFLLSHLLNPLGLKEEDEN